MLLRSWLMSATAGLMVLLAVAFWAEIAAAQDRFRLELPGDPTQTSTAILTREVLEVVDAAGQRTIYRARPELNSPDGRLRGFFSSAARQAIRWPVVGSGGFEIGAYDGTEVRWRRSRMVIVPEGIPAEAPAFNPPVNSPFIPPANSLAFPPANAEPIPPPVAGLPGQPQAPPMYVAARSVANTTQVAWIDRRGALILMEGSGNQWRNLPVRLSALLTPGAPSILVSGAGDALPIVYTCDPSGRLVEIAGGQQLRVCGADGAPAFPPGAQLADFRDGRTSYLAACDMAGRLWAYRLGDDRFEIVESQRDALTPGQRITVTLGAGLAELFVVDRRGDVRGYRIEDGQWSPTRRLFSGAITGEP